MARRRRRSRKRSGFGRFIEGMAVLVLLIVILTFGFSIANRYAGETNGLQQDIVNRRNGGELPGSQVQEPPLGLARDRIQLVVENGCGAAGLAREFSAEIRGPRFDVVDYRDADRYDYLETMILTNHSGRQAAQEVLRELEERYGLRGIQLTLTTDTIYAADVRLILGADLAEQWDREPDIP